ERSSSCGARAAGVSKDGIARFGAPALLLLSCGVRSPAQKGRSFGRRREYGGLFHPACPENGRADDPVPSGRALSARRILEPATGALSAIAVGPPISAR